MVYTFLAPLADQYQVFNLFRYLTFRTGGAVMTALLISFLLGPTLIRWLRHQQPEGQPIRDDGPAHFAKRGTPTMGGLLILISLVTSTLLWADLGNGFVWCVLFVLASFGVLGCWDDYLKLRGRSSRGLSGRTKLLFQAIFALLAAVLIARLLDPSVGTGLAIPFLKDVLVDLGWFFFPFSILVLVGSSNAVNLTDGLDGLAIVPVIIAASSFVLIAYLAGNVVFAQYLQIHYVAGAGELAVICGAVIGSGLGFLWWNAPPARVFMGDTGSLSLGGALGAISVITKHELVLVVIGGVFVLEAVSVIVQVISFRLTGRRVFAMAPLHHHFELKGWAEPTIVIRFWIVALVLALVGLSSLKLR